MSLQSHQYLSVQEYFQADGGWVKTEAQVGAKILFVEGSRRAPRYTLWLGVSVCDTHEAALVEVLVARRLL